MIEYDPRGWTSHLFDVKRSMAREIFSRVLTCTVFAAVVVVVHKNARAIAIPLSVHTLIGLVLGLLLVFRTNASYDRYWDGRRHWGGIINECRNLARKARSFAHDSPRHVAAIVAWTEAFPHAVMNHLRGATDLGPSGDRLGAADVEATLRARNVPLAVATRISERIGKASGDGVYSEYLRVELERSVNNLVDHLGGCERIRKTPLPFVYVAHLRRALILYCFTLPFALVESHGWITVGVVMLLSYFLFGIEEIGVEIENPFGKDLNDLPLEQFCKTVEGDLDDLLTLPPLAPLGGFSEPA